MLQGRKPWKRGVDVTLAQSLDNGFVFSANFNEFIIDYVCITKMNKVTQPAFECIWKM